MENKTVGVLGGLGPMASVYFYEMVLLGYCARCACNYVCDFNCSPKETRKNAKKSLAK